MEFADEDAVDVHWKAASLREQVKLLVLRGAETLQLDYSPAASGESSGYGGDVFRMPR